MAAVNHPRVVVIRVGNGGVWTSRGFFRTPLEGWLINGENYRIFFHLLYQVAAVARLGQRIITGVLAWVNWFTVHFYGLNGD